MQGENRSLFCISSKQRISWRWTNNFSVNKLTKKKAKKIWTAKHVFHGCSYKNSCFSELVYNSSIPVLMVYSYKDVLKDPALDLVDTFTLEGLLYLVYSFE